MTINSSDRSVGRTVGDRRRRQVAVTGLPRGRYTIVASKRGWVTAPYGAKAIGRPGSALSLTDGQRATVAIRMARGAVITGTVLDQNGQPPAAGMSIRVLQYVYAPVTGERRLNPVGRNSLGPDERGAYRVYGLAPGDYYVSAVGGQGFGAPGRDLHLTSDVDVEQAARAIQDGPSVAVADVPQRTIGMSPVFYPGTPSVAQATLVTVRAGEERTGVDFTVQYVPAVHIEGTISLPGGTVPPGTQVNLIASDPSVSAIGFEGLRTARTSAGGTFSFAEVTPGQYKLAARTAVAAPDQAPGPPSRWLWANLDLDVTGDDIRDLAVVLEDSLTVAGTVRFDSADGRSAPTSVRVSLQPEQSPGPVISAASVAADPDGHFTHRRRHAGPIPSRRERGRHAGRVDGAIGRRRRPGHRAGRSGHPPLDRRRRDHASAIAQTELSGHVLAPDAADYSIILFAVDRAQWSAQSGRLLFARAASDGTYRLQEPSSRRVPDRRRRRRRAGRVVRSGVPAAHRPVGDRGHDRRRREEGAGHPHRRGLIADPHGGVVPGACGATA